MDEQPSASAMSDEVVDERPVLVLDIDGTMVYAEPIVTRFRNGVEDCRISYDSLVRRTPTPSPAPSPSPSPSHSPAPSPSSSPSPPKARDCLTNAAHNSAADDEFGIDTLLASDSSLRRLEHVDVLFGATPPEGPNNEHYVIQYRIWKRPHLDELLDFVVEHFRVVVWSAAPRPYVERMCQFLFGRFDSSKRPLKILAQGECVRTRVHGASQYAKPLAKLASFLDQRSVREARVLDDTEWTYHDNPEQAIPIAHFQPFYKGVFLDPFGRPLPVADKHDSEPLGRFAFPMLSRDSALRTVLDKTLRPLVTSHNRATVNTSASLSLSPNHTLNHTSTTARALESSLVAETGRRAIPQAI